MNRHLVDRVALVTGASSGIGRACAMRLAAAGAAVAVNYRSSASAAEEVVSGIVAAGGRAAAVQADVGDEDDVAGMFAAISREIGVPSILVNNAGIQKDAMITDMSADDWDAVLRTNLRGQFLCARQFVRLMPRTPADVGGPSARGHIIFISSVHDRIPWPGRVNYAASKGGLDMLMRSIALELGPSNIRVNAVSPGAIRTNINRETWEDEGARRRLLEKIPVGRIGRPDDIARVVCWLTSDDSGYVHGATLYVDGGMTLYPSFQE